MDLDSIKVRVDKPYPKIVGATNEPMTVSILKNLASARTSELSAVLQYIYQSVVADKTMSDIADILEEIGIVEMTHLDMLMHAITDFGGIPKYEDSNGYQFNTNYINYNTKLKDMLNNNIVAEQKAIAEFLDKKCGEVDALIADIQQEIETLEQYKRSVITEAVTKGLDPSVPMKDSGIDWVGIMPKHWKKMPNKYLMYKEKTICPVYNGESILSLTMKGVVVRDLEAGGKMPTSFDGYQQIKAGNLLMCLFDIDVTPRCIGLICNNGVTSPAYSQFIMKKNAYAPFYSYYYLMVDFTKELLHMAKNLRHSLNEEQFGAILAPVPPIEEQQQIADYLDKKCKEIEEIIADKQSQIETLESYKKSLIYEYVTGKKEVE